MDLRKLQAIGSGGKNYGPRKTYITIVGSAVHPGQEICLKIDKASQTLRGRR